MKNLQDQRVCLKFCSLFEKLATEAYQLLLQAFKEDAMSRTHWCGRFRHGEMNLKDYVRFGHPASSQNHENVKKKCNENLLLTIDKI